MLNQNNQGQDENLDFEREVSRLLKEYNYKNSLEYKLREIAKDRGQELFNCFTDYTDCVLAQLPIMFRFNIEVDVPKNLWACRMRFSASKDFYIISSTIGGNPDHPWTLPLLLELELFCKEKGKIFQTVIDLNKGANIVNNAVLFLELLNYPFHSVD